MRAKPITFPGMLLALYIGTAPVYWFYSIPTEIISIAKMALMVGAGAAVLLDANRKQRLSLPRGMLGLWGALSLLFFLVPGLLKSSVVGVSTIDDLIYGFSFLWIFYLYVRGDGSIVKTFGLAVLIILPFAFVVIVAYATGTPNWSSPFVRGMSVADTGFGGLRTGWSVGLAFFLAPALMWIDVYKSEKPMLRFLGISSVVAVIVGSQLVVGGRSGLVASCLVLLIWMGTGKSHRWLMLGPLVVSFALLVDSAWVSQHLRFDRISNVDSVQDLDRFSASRITTYREALELIAREPAAGHGFGAIDGSALSSGSEVHNLWLRLAVQTGIGAPIVFAFVVLEILKQGLALLKARAHRVADPVIHRAVVVSLMSIILAGVTISMFEPHALLGTFQTSALWWAAAGAIGAMYQDALSQEQSGAGV